MFRSDEFPTESVFSAKLKRPMQELGADSRGGCRDFLPDHGRADTLALRLRWRPCKAWGGGEGDEIPLQ